MRMKRTCLAVFFLEIIISAFFAFLFTYKVSASELSYNNIFIEYKGENIPHETDEIYYVNDDISLVLDDIEVSESDDEMVRKAVNDVKALYPDEDIEFYKEDVNRLYTYNGELFTDGTQIEDAKVNLLISDNTDYDKRIYMIEKIRSYKIFRMVDDEKRIENVVDIKYQSPVYQFIFDNVKPSIEVVTDSDLSKIQKEGGSVSFNLKDKTGIKNIRLYINNNLCDTREISKEKRIIDYEYEVSLKTTDCFDNVLKLTVEDLCGNTSEYELNYKIDKESPTVNIDGISNGQVYGEKATFTISATDNSGKCALYYRCYYTDENGTVGCIEDNTQELERGGSIKKEYDKEGIYDVSCFAYDLSGNSSEIYRCSIGVNSKAPELRIDNVQTGKSYNNDVTVYAYLKELFYEGVNANLSGTVVTETGPKALNLPKYEIGSRLNKNIYTLSGDGEYTLKFSATDLVGRTVDTECSFNIDKTGPDIKIQVEEFDDEELNSHNGASVKSKVISKKPEVIIKTKDFISEYEIYASLYRKEAGDGYKEVNSSKVVSVGKSAEFNVDVPYEGEYMLKVAGKDLAGNISEKAVIFTVDENPPLIGYVSDFNQKYLKYFTLPKSFGDYIHDMTDTKYRAYLNSKEITSCDIKKDGKYLLQVVAVDEGGNKSEETIAFIVDNTMPKIIVSGIGGDGNVVKDDTVKLTLFDDEDYFKSAFINGKPIEIDGKQKEIEVKASEYGDYDISVEAADYAGNVTTQVVKMNCAYSSNPFTIRLDESDIKTLTKNDDEIRESFFKNKVALKVLIICGIIVATAVIFGAISLIDMRKHKG